MCQAGAIAAGNAVCVKVSELLPATSSLLAELFPKYLDPKLYRIVNGEVPVSTKVRIPTIPSFVFSRGMHSCWSCPGTTVSRCRSFCHSGSIDDALQSYIQARELVTRDDLALTQTVRFRKGRKNRRSGGRKTPDPCYSRSKRRLGQTLCETALTQI